MNDTHEAIVELLDKLNSQRATITSQAAEIERLREATNQCRLAFAGYVSMQSALNLLDALEAGQ